MKFCVILSLFVCYISLASCRPQTVQIEHQNLLHLQRSISQDQPEKRGSLEETRRILQEIDRINLALGYRKKMTLAFPRLASGEGYFYPRQQFRPEFLTKERDIFNQNSIRMINRRAINPFNNQNYYYPTPYLQLPSNGKTYAFKSGDFPYPLVYAPLNIVPQSYEKTKYDGESDGSIKLGTIIVLPKESRKVTDREPKASKKTEAERKEEKPDEKQEKSESSLIDDIVNYVPDALGFSDEDEDEREDDVAPALKIKAIKNDKYLNLALDLALKKHPQELEENDENRKLPPPLPSGANIRAFNFSNPLERLQNITKKFTITQRDETLKETTDSPKTPSVEDIDETEEDKLDEKEDEKSPFGQILAFGPKQQLQTFKEGGLIIQRLRVRAGGIAIAGPGGVATAGSGGTAIVGPNGIAFTHPRGLAIGGPGARIYAVPESTDLEDLALTHKARNLSNEGVLVARGPIVYYNEE